MISNKGTSMGSHKGTNRVPLKKGRIYVPCPTHQGDSQNFQYGDKTCIKRLYFKPNNKLRAISNLWICEKIGHIFLSDGSRGSSYWSYEKLLETNLERIGEVPNWNDLFPELQGE